MNEEILNKEGKERERERGERMNARGKCKEVKQ